MSKTKPQFDFEEALEALKSGRDLNGENGLLTPLIKQLTEAVLAAKLEQHIKKSRDEQNRKNGSTPLVSIGDRFKWLNKRSALGDLQTDTEF